MDTCASRSDVLLASKTARQGRAAIFVTTKIERLTTLSFNMKNKKNILFAIAGLVVGLLAVLAIHSIASNSAPASDTATTTAVTATGEDAFQSVYPLYDTNIVWDAKVALSVPPHTATNPTNSTIRGYEIESELTATTSEISAFTEPFRDYYDRVLLAKGWAIDPTFQADGPGASIWGFTRGTEILIFSYTPTFLVDHPNEPVQCPCKITFSILGGITQ